MDGVMVFGQNLALIEQKGDEDSVELKADKILVTGSKRPAERLLHAFLTDLLYSELVAIYEQIKGDDKVGILGHLDFEVVDKIDNRRQRVARLNGNTVLVRLNAVALPRSALEYVIAHEIAHTFTRRHTNRFWRTVELMCPNFEESRELLEAYGDLVTGESIVQSALLDKAPDGTRRRHQREP